MFSYFRLCSFSLRLSTFPRTFPLFSCLLFDFSIATVRLTIGIAFNAKNKIYQFYIPLHRYLLLALISSIVDSKRLNLKRWISPRIFPRLLYFSSSSRDAKIQYLFYHVSNYLRYILFLPPFCFPSIYRYPFVEPEFLIPVPELFPPLVISSSA